MLNRSSWLHLRIPFSYFLLPVYLFSLGISPNLEQSRILWTFLVVHLLLYPASNGYNSYFDKDEKSIGGLRNPPPVTRGLLVMAWCLDVLAIVVGFIQVNALFAVMLLVYGLVSKAYSHPAIRLKKYPVVGWLVTGFFQGFFTFLMCYLGINDFGLGNSLQARVLIPAFLTSLMLWGNYPLTQVYQHEEDTVHGDHTLSLALGIRGTFLFVMVIFSMAVMGFALFFLNFYSSFYSALFLLSLLPVVFFFLVWFYHVWKDSGAANFANTMWLNFLSATCLNAYFLYFFFATSHVGQYF